MSWSFSSIVLQSKDLEREWGSTFLRALALLKIEGCFLHFMLPRLTLVITEYNSSFVVRDYGRFLHDSNFFFSLTKIICREGLSFINIKFNSMSFIVIIICRK